MAEARESSHRNGKAAGASATVRAREACDRREWPAAFALLVEADERQELDGEGLELLAECARWVERNDRLVDALERAHEIHVACDDPRGALRTALALCYANADACHQAVAASWWKRAEELISRVPDGPERGLHAWFLGRKLGDQGDLDGHEESARQALEIAHRFGDRNVEALALVDLAHVATARGQTSNAMDAIDRATSLALAGEIGVLESGLVFCNAIWSCRCRGDWGRAGEWTDSANRWVARQQVAYFPGLCRVHRSEVLRIRGELAAAERESLEATRLLTSAIPRWAMIAYVELGEVRRRKGDMPEAMTAFQRALELGWDPQPGLALLVLAQGDPVSAHKAIERVFRQPASTLLYEDRANLLRARVTIAIAAGALEIAEASVVELETLAEGDSTPWDSASSAQSRGELELARGRTEAAVEHLARARAVWAELDAPYELAVCREILGKALRSDGDHQGALLEFGAARRIFERIGATLNGERVAARLAAFGPGETPAPEPHRLPPGSEEAGLCREGDYWSISFEGRVLRMKDGRGLRYLAALLERPGKDQWAVDLAAGTGPCEAARESRTETTAVLGDAGELLDGEARAAYRRRLDDLEEELQEARAHGDPARVDRIRAEMDALGRQLAAAVGLGGRARRAGSTAERARQSVTKAIRGVIRKMTTEHPSLGRHLEAAVRTGTACRFEPDPSHPARWRVDRAHPSR
jgi:tetratricopeptide (TPR) repeat protein